MVRPCLMSSMQHMAAREYLDGRGGENFTGCAEKIATTQPWGNRY